MGYFCIRKLHLLHLGRLDPFVIIDGKVYPPDRIIPTEVVEPLFRDIGGDEKLVILPGRLFLIPFHPFGFRRVQFVNLRILGNICRYERIRMIRCDHQQLKIQTFIRSRLPRPFRHYRVITAGRFRIGRYVLLTATGCEQGC